MILMSIIIGVQSLQIINRQSSNFTLLLTTIAPNLLVSCFLSIIEDPDFSTTKFVDFAGYTIL